MIKQNDGIRFLLNNNWELANHSASHYPITEQSAIHLMEDEFINCDKIIKELFEKSVDGEAYDLEKYGQYFRPAGVSYQAGSQVSVPKADRPVAVEKTANPVNAEVKETAPATAPTAQPTGDSAKRAEDILKLIRSRQAK